MELCPACYEVPPTTPPEERERDLMVLARSGASDPAVRAVAQALYRMAADRLGRAPTTPELVQWLMGAVHLLVDYVPDPPGREVFQTVLWTLTGGCGFGPSPLTGLRKGCGDCEDLAGLLVALCLALGVEARVSWMDQPGAPLNHVTAMVLYRGRWRYCDATIPGARFGENPYDALARVGPGFRSRVFGVEDAGRGLFAPAGDLTLAEGLSLAPRVRGLRANASPTSESFSASPQPDFPVVVNAVMASRPAPAPPTPPGWTPESTDVVALASQAAGLRTFAEAQKAAADAARADAASKAAHRAAVAAAFPGYQAYLGFEVNPDGTTTPAAGYAANVGRFMLVPTSEEAGAVSVRNGDHFRFNDASFGVIADRPATTQTILQLVDGAAAQYATRWSQLLALFADTLDIRYALAVAAAHEAAAAQARSAEDAAASRARSLATPVTTQPLTTLRTVGMVPYWTVYFDGAAAQNGRWDGDAWVVDAPAGQHALRITPPPGVDAPARSMNVNVPLGREMVVSFTQVPEEQRPATSPDPARGIIAVRGAPAGVTPARVVLNGGSAGDPSQSQPLTPREGGYLAVSWPIGQTSRLQVGPYDVPATATAVGDTVYDYTPDGLVFRPEVTSAASAPAAAPLPVRAAYRPSAAYRAVSLTTAGDGVDVGRGTPMVARETVGSVGFTLPGGPARMPPTSVVWEASVPAHRYILRAERDGGEAPREGVIDIPASAAGLEFEFTDADVRWVGAATGTLAVVGVPQADLLPRFGGAVGAALANGSRYIVDATPAGAPPRGDGAVPLREEITSPAGTGDAIGSRSMPSGRYSAALAPGRYTVRVFVEAAVGRSMPTRTLVRSAEATVVGGDVTEVAFASMIAAPGDSAAAEQAATSFDRERAAQFAVGRSGIVSTDPTGLRNGYLSDISQRLLPGVRRVVREFEPLGPADASGRVPYALLYRGMKRRDADGMFAVPMTPGELQKTKEWLAFLGRQRPDASGYYPGDIHV